MGSTDGPTTLRPHYHAAVFNYWPKDAKPYKKNEVGDMLFTSEELNKIWGNGYVIVGNVTYESAAYIARYVYKKAYGGDLLPLKAGKQPEFTTCSKRPGLAKNWWLQPELWEKILRNNGVIIPSKDGIKIKPIPQYLRKLWKNWNHKEYYAWQEKHKQNQIKEQQYILKQANQKFADYRRQTNLNKLEKLKRLDKPRQKNIELA